MMVAIFAAMLLALLFSRLDQPRLAILSLAVAFGLVIYLFQWEIYSPQTGFRMPWIQTDWRGAPITTMASRS